MSDFPEFLASLPPHLKPSNETERILMQYAWYDGHTTGIKHGLAKLNESLLRLVPKKV